MSQLAPATWSLLVQGHEETWLIDPTSLADGLAEATGPVAAYAGEPGHDAVPGRGDPNVAPAEAAVHPIDRTLSDPLALDPLSPIAPPDKRWFRPAH